MLMNYATPAGVVHRPSPPEAFNPCYRRRTTATGGACRSTVPASL